MKIKDYLVLKEIAFFLENLFEQYLRENNGYSSSPAEEVENLFKSLREILNKLENED